MRTPSYQLLGVEATTEEGVLMSHPNARLTVHGRLVLVERIESGWSVSAAARAAGVSRQTAGKWAHRFRGLGEMGLVDASSRPHRLPPTVPSRRCHRIVNARLRHRRGPHWLAWRLHIARSTIYAVLRRYGLSRLRTKRTEPSAMNGLSRATWCTST